MSQHRPLIGWSSVILCRISSQVGVEPVYIWNNVGKTFWPMKIIENNGYRMRSGFEQWRLAIESLIPFSEEDLPALNWTRNWAPSLSYGPKIDIFRSGTMIWIFFWIITICVTLIRRGKIYNIIWSPPQGKRFSALGRALPFTFPWSLSINNMVLLSHEMRECQVGFFGIWICARRRIWPKSKSI